jgi:hypothetical protein
MDVIAHLQTQLIREEIGDDATDQEIQQGLRYTVPLLLHILWITSYALVF